MENLPNDLIIYIFKDLSVAEIIFCLNTCKALKQQNYEQLWKNKCVEFDLEVGSNLNYEDTIKLRWISNLFLIYFLSHSNY